MNFTILKFNTMISNANGAYRLRVCTPKFGLDNATLVLASFWNFLKSRAPAQLDFLTLTLTQISTCSILTLTLTLTLNSTLTLLLTGVTLTLTLHRTLTLTLTLSVTLTLGVHLCHA